MIDQMNDEDFFLNAVLFDAYFVFQRHNKMTDCILRAKVVIFVPRVEVNESPPCIIGMRRGTQKIQLLVVGMTHSAFCTSRMHANHQLGKAI